MPESKILIIRLINVLKNKKVIIVTFLMKVCSVLNADNHYRHEIENKSCGI